MERKIAKIGGEEIQLYMRTYYSLLRSSHAFEIETLVESHIALQSSLHVGAGTMKPDIAALLYAALRLPPCIDRVEEVLVGQMEKSFVLAGFRDITEWTRVYAPGRRRRLHFDSVSKLAVYIVSRSDIDDLVPILTAYQVEWNKLHVLLKQREYLQPLEIRKDDHEQPSEADLSWLAGVLDVPIADAQRLAIIWRGDFWRMLWRIAQTRKNFSLRLVNGSLADYRRATASWWEELRDTVRAHDIDVENRPIYFVSSNTHSMLNLLTGFATRYEEDLINYIRQQNHDTLLAQYETLQVSANKNLENFLYYVLGKYLASGEAQEKQREDEQRIGIVRVPNQHGFEVEAQVIELSRLRSEWMDARARVAGMETLVASDALILNIDYPLGLAAYEILSRITERNDHLLGVYIMGKSATLNARVGDIMIPNVVHDEHSQNTYLFNNVFCAADVMPYMTQGNVLDNQKALTVLGTFLQNPNYMSVFYREGYTDVEMEAGPYFSALYEAFRPKRHPENEIVNLYGAPFDIGMLHYASDAPMKVGQNLGAGSLAYAGVEPTYASAIVILQRIFLQEVARLSTNHRASVAGL